MLPERLSWLRFKKWRRLNRDQQQLELAPAAEEDQQQQQQVEPKQQRSSRRSNWLARAKHQDTNTNSQEQQQQSSACSAAASRPIKGCRRQAASSGRATSSGQAKKKVSYSTALVVSSSSSSSSSQEDEASSSQDVGAHLDDEAQERCMMNVVVDAADEDDQLDDEVSSSGVGARQHANKQEHKQAASDTTTSKTLARCSDDDDNHQQQQQHDYATARAKQQRSGQVAAGDSAQPASSSSCDAGHSMRRAISAFIRRALSPAPARASSRNQARANEPDNQVQTLTTTSQQKKTTKKMTVMSKVEQEKNKPTTTASQVVVVQVACCEQENPPSGTASIRQDNEQIILAEVTRAKGLHSTTLDQAAGHSTAVSHSKQALDADEVGQGSDQVDSGPAPKLTTTTTRLTNGQAQQAVANIDDAAMQTSSICSKQQQQRDDQHRDQRLGSANSAQKQTTTTNDSIQNNQETANCNQAPKILPQREKVVAINSKTNKRVAVKGSKRSNCAIPHWPLGKQTISHLAWRSSSHSKDAIYNDNHHQYNYVTEAASSGSCDPSKMKPDEAGAADYSTTLSQTNPANCSSSSTTTNNYNNNNGANLQQSSNPPPPLSSSSSEPSSRCSRLNELESARKTTLGAPRESTRTGCRLSFGDTEDILSPHLAAYTNFYESIGDSSDLLSLKSGQFYKHKRPFGRQYEWPTASWIHNATKPEWINTACPKIIPPSFKATILAASKLRRGSYDDQRGDNDINIILAPSDLQNFEKQRNKFTRDCLTARPNKIRRSSSTQISSSSSSTSPNSSTTNNKNNLYTLTKTKALLFEQQNLLFLNNKQQFNRHSNKSTSGPKLFNDQQDEKNHDFHYQVGENDRYNNNNNNYYYYNSQNTNNNNSGQQQQQLGQLQLAKALLDQDYSLTVQLFIKKSALNWNFNSFTFDAICCGRSLTELLLHLFDYYNLYNRFRLDITNVLKCFRLLEFGYHGSNPYHNSVHAADVTQAMHCFIQEKRIRKYMTDLEILSSIMAAVCHDLDHPGVNQAFLINTKNPLADLYNSESVLENHHWRFALCIFKESNIFDHFQPEVYNQMTEQLKHLILATDIARQNEYLRRFQGALSQIKTTTTNQDPQQLDDTTDTGFSLQDTDSRALVLQIALKCADLGNPCRPWLISRVWSNLICDELFKMGRVERKLGLPLTPICQQEKTSIATIQTDFFRFIVLPLLQLWDQFLQSPLSKLLMSNFEHNYQRWQRANRIVQQLKRRKSVASLERIHNSDTDNAQIISLIVMKFYKAK